MFLLDQLFAMFFKERGQEASPKPTRPPACPMCYGSGWLVTGAACQCPKHAGKPPFMLLQHCCYCGGVGQLPATVLRAKLQGPAAFATELQKYREAAASN